MVIDDLIESRQYWMLKEGIGFFFTKTLQEDVTYIPTDYKRQYKVFTGYAGGKSNLIWNKFIKDGNIFYPPQDDWDTYVSLFGGGLGDVALVHEHFPTKKLIINEYNKEMYDIYKSLRDYPSEVINYYRKLISTMPSPGSQRSKLTTWYKNLKLNYRDYYGNRRDWENSAILLFLLHTSFSYLWGNRGNGLFNGSYGKIRSREFFNDRVEIFKKWNKLLNKATLWNRDYSEVPLPSTRSFIYSDVPYYDTMGYGLDWKGTETSKFTKFYNDLNKKYGMKCKDGVCKGKYYLAASNNHNPVFKRDFKKTLGWNYTQVDHLHSLGTNTRFDDEGNNTHKETKEVLVTNYEMGRKGVTESLLYPHNKNSYVNSYVKTYNDYISRLI